jgi:hypothetical protein
MMFMIPKVYQPDTPAAERAGKGFTPPADAVSKMMKYNEELANAGALLGLDGFHPLMNGARVAFTGGTAHVTDGPFIQPKEVLGGYWMIQVESKEEAIEWAKKVPAADGDLIEVRRIFEMEDFPEDVQKAAENSAVNAHIRKSS